MIELRHPEPPRPPYFDAARGAWVLSRFADVLAALQHPDLWSVGRNREIDRAGRDEFGRLKERGAMLARFSQPRIAELRPLAEAEARRILEALPTGRTVDLLREFALPWCLTVAMLGTGANPADRERLGGLSARVFAGTGASDDSPLKADAAAATAELERVFENGPIPMGEPTFVALSQTMARLLANAWLALIAHPEEYARLRAHPELMPAAVEELLRYSGIVRRVFRRAASGVEIGGAAIPAEGLAMLMLESANRDPEQFPDPNRLALDRVIACQVSLGYGRNSCVGAIPVRMAIAAATTVLVSTFASADFEGVSEWRMGSGFCFPASVDVTFR